MKMTFKTLNKKVALLSVGLITASALAGLANIKVGATANSLNSISNGEVKIFANSAAGNTATTTNNDGTNTDTGITNGQTNPQLGNQGTTVNDGSVQSVTGATMANVTFTATKWTGAAAPAQSDVSGTSASWNGAVTTKTTDSTGLADFTGLTTGYYLFQQVTLVNGITTVKNFIVQVNTTSGTVVNVYPKLDMSASAGLGDVVTTNADANHNTATGASNTLDGTNITTVYQNLTDTSGTANNTAQANGTWAVASGKTNNNTTTAGAANTVNWNVNTVFDSSQTSGTVIGTATSAGTYVITDKLPTGVTYTGVTINYTDKNGATQTFTPSSIDTTTTPGTVVITLTAAEQEAIANNAGNTDVALNTVIATTVNASAVGVLSDSATYAATNAYGAVLTTNITAQSSTVNVGGVTLQKTDALTGQQLAGAKFALVRADNLADAQAYAKTLTIKGDGTVSGANTGTSANLVTNTNVDGSAGTPVVATVDNTGTALFTGLNLVDTNVDTTNTQNYYAVELQAPTNYNMPTQGTVFAVKADTAPSTSDFTTNTITNATVFELPFTGGRGIAMLVIVAAGAGFAAIAIKRRKKDEDKNSTVIK